MKDVLGGAELVFTDRQGSEERDEGQGCEDGDNHGWWVVQSYSEIWREVMGRALP